MTLSPVKETYTPNEVITATSDGRPEPGFLWTRLEGGDPAATVTGPRLTITADMKGFNRYLCNASNTLINGEVKSVTKTVNFTVTGKISIRTYDITSRVYIYAATKWLVIHVFTTAVRIIQGLHAGNKRLCDSYYNLFILKIKYITAVKIQP